ncbi:MAG: NUDIX hydrolase [Aestuariibacter sp.]|nr:NUDIX hydrolase [Aestuariibacter sp.]
MQNRSLILPKHQNHGSLLTAFFVVLTLFGCSPPSPSAPFCRTTAESLTVDSTATGAACLIRTENSVLLIRHRLTGKLDFPAGGRNEGESLQCTAHREAWEETGHNVEVREQHATTASGMPIFTCTADESLTRLPATFDAPDWAALEVIQLEKTDPFLLNKNALRFADDLIPLRDAFVKAGKQVKPEQ